MGMRMTQQRYRCIIIHRVDGTIALTGEPLDAETRADAKRLLGEVYATKRMQLGHDLVQVDLEAQADDGLWQVVARASA
jgi:hypothetical protein